MTSKIQGTPVEEVSVETLPKDHVAALTSLFGGACEQRLLRGTYGITAYELLEPKSAGEGRRICVVSHGLGQCHPHYNDWALVDMMQEAGYTVLAFSFYGHGWSYAGDEVMGTGGGCCSGPAPGYDSPIMLTQVKELLTHVLRPGEPVDFWIGHSTGGLLGVYVAQADVWPVRNLGLISPAFWAVKDALGTALDRSPVLSRMLLNSSSLRGLAKDGMLKNNDRACMKNKAGDGFKYPAAHKDLADNLVKTIDNHPQLYKAMMAIAASFLNLFHMPDHRALFKDLAQRKEGPAKIVMVWGTGDEVVPYKHASEVVAWNPDRVKLISPEMGHESCFEDPKHVAELLLEGLRGGKDKQ